MRFNKLKYLHTDKFDDVEEIKFVGNFGNDTDDVLTVEIWLQDNSAEVVIVDNTINSVEGVTIEEEKFVLEYAKSNGILQ